jgi:hypothetical protein
MTPESPLVQQEWSICLTATPGARVVTLTFDIDLHYGNGRSLPRPKSCQYTGCEFQPRSWRHCRARPTSKSRNASRNVHSNAAACLPRSWLARLKGRSVMSHYAMRRSCGSLASEARTPTNSVIPTKPSTNLIHCIYEVHGGYSAVQYHVDPWRGYTDHKARSKIKNA